MKKSIANICVLATLAVPLTVSARTASYEIELTNPMKKARTDVPVAIDILSLAPDLDVTQAIVLDGDNEIPCQIDDTDRDNRSDALAFVIDIDKKEKKKLLLTLSDEGEMHQYAPRVYGNFMLYGKKKGESVNIKEVTVPGNVNFYSMCYGHGPMFESELVGYRVYFNEKQTLDPYGKFNKGLELQESRFYPSDQQLEAGFGDDVLLAGNSCGIGAFKGWNGSEATHIMPVDYRTERIISTGPVRTVAEVEVQGWDYQGRRRNMLNRYTLYAGHRDLQIDAEFDAPLSDETFCTGVERIMGDETVSWSDHKGLIASWGRHWPVTDTVKYAKETIGIATYVPKKYVVKEAEDPSNFLYVVAAPGNDKITYHTMFTSKKETFGYDDSEAWFAALPAWKEELDNPLLIKLTAL